MSRRGITKIRIIVTKIRAALKNGGIILYTIPDGVGNWKDITITYFLISSEKPVTVEYDNHIKSPQSLFFDRVFLHTF